MFPRNKYDTSLLDDEFDTVDAAARHAMSIGTDDFHVIKIIEWEVVTRAEEVSDD